MIDAEALTPYPTEPSINISREMRSGVRLRSILLAIKKMKGRNARNRTID